MSEVSHNYIGTGRDFTRGRDSLGERFSFFLVPGKMTLSRFVPSSVLATYFAP